MNIPMQTIIPSMYFLQRSIVYFVPCFKCIYVICVLLQSLYSLSDFGGDTLGKGRKCDILPIFL